MTDENPATTAPTRPDLTLRQKILLAAVDLAPESDSFTVEDLVVRAWRRHPESFSLRGYDLPDSNRVQAKLSGVDGLCGLGWIEKADQRGYRLTAKGRRLAARLATPAAPVAEPPHASEPDPAPAPRRVAKLRNSTTAAPAAVAEPPRAPAPAPRPTASVDWARPLPPPRPTNLTDEDRARVRRFANCNALRKFLRGSPIAFADACEFWGAGATRLDRARLYAAEEVLRRAVEALGAEGAVDAALPPLSTCYGLLNLHRLMASRFAREVDAAAAEARRG